LNPLDCPIWKKVEERASKLAGKKETKATYAKKIKRVAKGLGFACTKKTVGCMKERIKGTLDAGGRHIEFDRVEPRAVVIFPFLGAPPGGAFGPFWGFSWGRFGGGRQGPSGNPSGAGRVLRFGSFLGHA